MILKNLFLGKKIAPKIILDSTPKQKIIGNKKKSGAKIWGAFSKKGETAVPGPSSKARSERSLEKTIVHSKTPNLRRYDWMS